MLLNLIGCAGEGRSTTGKARNLSFALVGSGEDFPPLACMSLQHRGPSAAVPGRKSSCALAGLALANALASVTFGPYVLGASTPGVVSGSLAVAARISRAVHQWG